MNLGPRRCDHDPRSPRLDLVVALVADLPKLISDAVERCRRIYDEPDTFPELTGRALVAEPRRVRRRRTSRLEAISLTLAALLRLTDQRTHRVGRERRDGLCNGVTLVQLGKHTGLSRWRLCRALAELEAAGYIVTKQPVEELETPRPARGGRKGMQTHRGYPAVRWITPLAWSRLAFTPDRLSQARKYAAAQWREKQAPPVSPAAASATRRRLGQLATSSGAGAARRLPAAYFELELRLKHEHPEWAYEHIRAEARRRLGL